MQLQLGPHPRQFIWASGFEDTFVPQIRPGHRALDEYALLGHYDHWREDLLLARDLGVQALRWGVPWYRVQPTPNSFDWCWTDQVIPYMVEELGITPIVDLMHYGCPFWLEREFANPAYPELVAAYAAAFAERYRPWVRWYTPLNEPVMNAWMCGQRGVWPPYLRGDVGYARLIVQLALGIVATVRAIKHAVPDSTMVHVDVAGTMQAADPVLEPQAERMRLRGLVCYDLITGRVNHQHPLGAWLQSLGVADHALHHLHHHAITLDAIGLNFYPQWSTKELAQNRTGRHYYRPVEKDGAGFADLIASYYQRYNVPILITETSARGSHAVRAAWLADSVAAVKHLRGRGVPVFGYTWFPLGTMINWSYRFGTKSWEHYRLELGMYHLNGSHPRTSDRWQASPLVEPFRQLIRDPLQAIGALHTEHQSAEHGSAEDA